MEPPFLSCLPSPHWLCPDSLSAQVEIDVIGIEENGHKEELRHILEPKGFSVGLPPLPPPDLSRFIVILYDSHALLFTYRCFCNSFAGTSEPAPMMRVGICVHVVCARAVSTHTHTPIRGVCR